MSAIIIRPPIFRQSAAVSRCSGLLINLLARFKSTGNTALWLHGRLLSADRLQHTDIAAHLFPRRADTDSCAHACKAPGTQVSDALVLAQLHSITTFSSPTNYTEYANALWECALFPKERPIPARQKVHQHQMSWTRFSARVQRELYGLVEPQRCRFLKVFSFTLPRGWLRPNRCVYRVHVFRV